MSNKGQFEYIEQKIREAAEHEQPAFDEKAWQHMEAKLNNDEKKRRPFFWLWFLLLVLIAGGWGIYQHTHSSATAATEAVTKANKSIENTETQHSNTAQPETISEKLVNSSQSAGDNVAAKDLESDNTINTSNNTIAISSVNKNKSVEPSHLNSVASNADHSKPENLTHKKIHQLITRRSARRQKINSEKAPEEMLESAEKIEVNLEKIKTVNGTSEQKSGTKETAEVEKVTDKKTPSANLSKEVENKIDTAVNSAKAKEKKSSTNNRGFYLLGTIGADAGSVKLFSFGNSTITTKYGLGIGYQLNKRWSIQTGIYAVNKKYIAGPKDYHPKAGSYWNNVNMDKVDAACLVYEIPLAVKYNFITRPVVTYYAAAGLSSYIMKSENYDYYYHYNSSTVQHEKYYTYTGNKHFFSVLTIAAGVEKKISSKFSLLAEPSLSIPLAGVGDGSVKLFSTAVLLGVKYRPFQKR